MKNSAAISFSAALCLTLLSSAPARAAAPNAVFNCTPSEFSMLATPEGFVLQGGIATPSGGYTYNVSPMQTDANGIGQAVLTVEPPAADTGLKTPSREKNDTGLSTLTVAAALGAAGPVSHVVVQVEKPFATGPREIECTQIGGAQ